MHPIAHGSTLRLLEPDMCSHYQQHDLYQRCLGAMLICRSEVS